MDVRRVPGMWAPVVKRVPFRRWPAQPGQGGEGRVAVAALLAMTALLAVAWPAAAQTAPAAPTLTAAAGNTQVMLAWTQGDDGGSPLTGHEYWQSIDGGDNTGATWTAIPNSAAEGANATSYTVTGLSNGTTYTFYVRAVNAEGPGAESNQVTATPATAPAAPTALTATAGHTQVTLRWTHGDDGGSALTGHEYRQAASGEEFSDWTAIPNSAATGANGTSYTVTGLSNGTTYTFYVRAVNAEGPGAESNQVTATPATVPAAPTALTATAGHTQVMLAWTHGEDGGSVLTGHEYRQAASGEEFSDWTAIPNSTATGANATSYTVTGLSNGVEYMFAVRARNAEGESAASPAASATPAATAPAAPTALTATAGHTQVTLRWTHGDDGGSPLTGHEYRQAASGEEFSDWTAIPNSAATGANGASYTVTGLSNGVEYMFAVRARNAEGESAASPAASATPAATVPVAPTALTATTGHTQVMLAWTPGEDGGSPLTGHEYRQSTDEGDMWTTWTAIPNSTATGANATSYTVTGLSNGVEYTFQVRVGNAVGLGAPSPQASATPAHATVPAAPTALTATAGHTQVTLRWTHGDDGGSALTGHEYRQGGTGATWSEIPLSAVNQANATSYTVTGLSNGVEYTFQVRARNAVGESAASLGASATPAATAPARPTNLTATAGHTQVKLEWTNGHDGGSPITRHEYQQYEGDGRGPVTAIPDSGPDGAHFSSYTVTGLRNGRTYSYRVHAVNAVGPGDWEHSASTTPMTADPPAAPTALTASAGDTRVTLAWTQGDDGGSALTRHEYRQSTDTGTMWADWTAIPNSAGNEAHATSYTVSGLTNGTSYTFQVRAVNAVGPGGPSGNADATPATSPPPPTLTASAGDTQVWLTWTSRGDGGRPLTGYEYRQQAGSEVFGAWAPIPASAPTGAHFTSYTVTGLTNGTTYTFQVRAGNAVGDGAAASPASATPMLTATVPPAPPTLTATAGNAQVWLTWASGGDGGRPLTGHEYRVSTVAGTWAAWTPIPASAADGAHRTSYTVSGLTNGTTYTFQVRAGNAVGPGAASPAARATPVTVPAVPRSLTASPGDTEVTLKWIQGDDGGSPITGHEYRQQAGSGAVSMWTAIPASAPAGQNGMGYTVTGLTNGTRYTFHVRAVSAEGRSPASPPASATPATVPAAPTTLTATAGNTRVTLAWTNGGDGGSPITGHQYRQQAGSGVFDNWLPIPASAPEGLNGTSYTVTGLTNGTSYTFQVRAVNALGPSPVSRQVASTPTSTVTMIPRGSPSLTATTGNARVTLAWTRVDDGGSPLTRHEYRQVAGRGVFSDWTRIPDSAPEGTHFMSYTVTGLSNGTTYGFVVRAVNAVGESTVSNRATATPTTARAPLAPPALTATAGDTRVTLAWTQGADGGSPITGHEYRQQAGSGAFGAWTAIPDSAATGAHGASYTVSGLTNGIRYSFYVRAVNIVGPGGPSAGTRATPVAVPPPPSLTATAGNTQVWLAWTSRGDGGSPLTGHEYRQQAGSGVFDTWLPIPDSAPQGAHVGSYIVTGLTNGTSYTFQVRAGNAEGDGAASSPARATPTVATTVPAAPPSLTATPGNAQVWLTWTRGSDGGSPLTGHQYRQRTDSGSMWTEWTAIPDSAPAGAHGKSYTVTGLTNGTSSTFEVRAGNAEGDGAASPAASATPGTVPAAPPSLTATPGNAQVRLAWTRGDDGGSPLTGHQYRQRTDSGSTWTQWSAIPDSAPAGVYGASYTVTGLSNGTTYTFEVRAGNTAGASLASPAASATPRMVPAAPPSLTATPGNAQVTLAWTRGGDGGSPFTGHQYRQRTDSGSMWTEWSAIPDSAADGAHVASYRVTGLSNGTTYTFEVRAGNAVGEGLASPAASATPGAPAVPRDLTAAPDDTQVRLTWTRGEGGSPLTGHEYRQQVGSGGGGDWTPIPDSALKETHFMSYTVTGLTNGTPYTFEVRAVNAVGPSPASNAARATPGAPAVPRDLTAAPDDTQVRLTWTRGEGGSPLTGHEYRQQVGSGGGGDWTPIPDSAPAGRHGTSYTVTGLSNGTTYTFTVRAVNAVGESPASNEARVTPGAPPAPQALGTRAGDTEVMLTWLSGGSGQSPIVEYEYRQQVGSGGGGDWTPIPDSAPGGTHFMSYTVTGLTNGTPYMFDVRAVNAVGEGPASDAKSATPGVPSVPQELTATPKNAQVTLAWTRGDDSSSPLTGHEYRQQAGSGAVDDWAPIPDSAPAGAHETSYTVTGLTNGTRYTFEVRAVNAVGASAASASVSATPATGPSAPRNLTATSGNTQVTLAWDSGGDGGRPLTEHQYRQQAGSGAFSDWTRIPDSQANGPHAMSYTVTGLTNGTTYEFEVRAGNGVGAGAASESASATPRRVTVPPPPTNLRAEADDAQVRLAWRSGGDGGRPLIRHQYRQSADAGHTWGAWIPIPSSAPRGVNFTSYTVRGLTNGTEYLFQVRAVNELGVGAGSASVSATPRPVTVPPSPTNLTAESDDAQVRLAWDSGGDGGRPLTEHQYRQQAGSGAFSDWTRIPDSQANGPHAMSYTVTGLTNGTEYLFQVRAVNELGAGSASASARATPVAPTPPAAPTLTATPGNAQVRLAWRRGGDGGRPLTEHQYRQSADDGGTWAAWTRIPASAPGEAHVTRYTVTGLTNDTEYLFQVRAVNELGAGSASASARATPQLVTVPPPPTNLTAEADDAQVTLAWTRGGDGGRPLTEHQYRQSLDDGGTWAAWTPIPASASGEAYVTRYTVRGLTNGTTYTFEVRAVNELGVGAVSNTAQARPTGEPTIVALALTSDPDAADGSPDDDTYIRGATVEVTVTFSEAVTVQGTPQLTLDLGGTRAPAAYVRGTGTPHVVFAYTIKAGDVDSDGLAIPANALTRPAGATLQNLVGTRDARVPHPAVPAQAGHQVDGVPPTLEAAELDLAQASRALVLTFSKPLASHAVPAPEAFAIAVERPGDYTVTDVALDGATVTLTLTRAVAGNTRGTVTYTPGRAPLQDVPGNAVAAFQGEYLTVLVDATLSELTLPGVPLTPAFAPDRLSYTATVASHVADLTLTATPTDPAATVALTPADADAATAAHDVALPFGRTTLQVTVTGVDTLTRQTYTVTVTRRVVSAPGLTAWLARFGRTVATQVTDAVGTRLRAAPGQGSQVTVGGYRLPLGERGAGAAPGSSRWGADSAGAAGRGPDPRQVQPRQVTLRDLLVGSTFQLTLGRDPAAAPGPRVTAWGRVGTLQFNGHADALAVDGDVLTGTLGVDGAWDRWLAGVAVSHSRGDGALTQAGAQAYDGALEQTLTSLQPYLRYAVTDRLMVWGLVGYGWGELTVAPAPGVRATTDTALLLGAVGSRGILLAAPEHGGFELATRTDVMLLRMTADAAAAGLLPAEDAAVHRLRLVLEGSRAVTWAEGRTLRPAAEIGLRHDWGDAETGLGVEVGGQVQYADPGYGLTVDAGGRVLLAHAASAYQEWGAWGTVRLAPGGLGQGLALTLTPAWGATTSGVEGLWTRPTPAGPRQAPGGRLHAEVGYAFAPGNLGVVTPYAGTVLEAGPARTWRLGTRWQVGGRRFSGLHISLEGQRQKAAGPQPVNQGLHCQVTWGF